MSRSWTSRSRPMAGCRPATAWLMRLRPWPRRRTHPGIFRDQLRPPNDAAGGAQRTRAHCFAVVGQSTVGSSAAVRVKACGAGSPASPSERKTRGSTAKSPLLALGRSDDHRFPIRLLLLAEEEVELVDALDDTILGHLPPGPMLTNCSLQSRTWSIQSAFLHPRRTKPGCGLLRSSIISSATRERLYLSNTCKEASAVRSCPATYGLRRKPIDRPF